MIAYLDKIHLGDCLEVLKGDYDLDKAREDLLSIVNSSKYGRGTN